MAGVAIILAGLIQRTHRGEPTAEPVAADSSLLVLTWVPSLCPVESSASGCRSGRVDQRGHAFILHGLWPQPRSLQYYGVPAKAPARDRPAPLLPPELQNRLGGLMSDSAVMILHEWYAHGTCSGVTPTEYFVIATGLADQAIAILDPFFGRRAGGRITAAEVREAVEAGAGTGSRVALAYREARGEGSAGRSVVYEARLSLPGVARLGAGALGLGQALSAGPAVGPGCAGAAVP